MMLERTALNALYYNTAENRTYAVFTNGNTVLHRRPADLIDGWCRLFGSTMKGRQDAFRSMTGTVQKPAVLISEQGPLLMPDASAEADDCTWLAYDNILQIRGGNGQAFITFVDGTRIVLNRDVRVIRSQYRRCTEFMSQLHKARNVEHIFTEPLSSGGESAC